MAKKPTNYRDYVTGEPQEVPSASDSVAVPVELLDDLFAYVAQGNDVAIADVTQSIRELAETQKPELWKK